MRLPKLRRALRLARRLKVLDQATGTLVPFRFNREQRRILKKALRTRRLVVGKGRQVGCTTIIAYLMMLVALLNPGLPCCVVADDQDKANATLAKIKAWLGQLGVTLAVSNVESITLPNGARIDALSAISNADGGESRVGRTYSYGFIHATEMGFWRNASAVWAGLTRTALKTCMMVVESTGTPGETLFRDIFEKARDSAEEVQDGTGWLRHFIGTEQHDNYRADPGLISDETWARLQVERKFTRRDSAAWWWITLRDDLRGDVLRMLREAPIVPDDMFTFAEGQHIRRWNAAPVAIDGDWNVYVTTIDEPVILAIDVAAGLGDPQCDDELGGEPDASSMFLMGHRTGRTLRTWRNNTTPIPQFIKLVLETRTKFKPIATIVESNGIGHAVWQSVSHLPGAVEQTSGSSTGEVAKRRDEFRDAIEAGDHAVGGHLLAEIKQSVVKGKKSIDGRLRVVFEGHDDVISAGSFAAKWRKEHPWRAPAPAPVNPMTHVDRKTVRKQRNHRGMF